VFKQSASSSKEFVEHLRTVHFALIVVSTGLILLAFSSKSYNARSAYREIDEIVKLQHSWSPNWIVQHCRGVSTQNGSYEGIPRGAFESQNRISGLVQTNKPSRIAVMFVIPREGWGCWEKGWQPGEPVTGLRGSLSVPPTFAEFPNTLSDFRKWWDNLATTHTFVIPESISMQGNVFRGDGILVGTADLTDAHSKDSLEEVELLTNYEFYQDDSPSEPRPAKDAFPFALQGELPSSQEEGLNGMGEFASFPVATYREAQVDQGELVKSFTNWHVGIFEKSFVDLAQAAHGLEDVDLEEARKIISGEASKGNETFEAFGLKFPAGQITFWGSIVLISIQLYLFLYLKQLSGRLRPDDPGWDIPWIGMDDSFLWTRITFSVTLLLPCVALASLGIHSAWQVDRVPVGKILAFVFAFVLSMSFAFFSWRFRPRIERGATSSGPSQRFE